MNWFSTYHVSITGWRASPSKAGAVRLGDAADIQGLLAAQGMNTGIGDAIKTAVEAGGSSGRPCAGQAARQLRGGTDRLCSKAGRDHRSRVQLRHRRGPDCRYPSYARCAGAIPEGDRVRGGSGIHLPNGLTDHFELSRQPAYQLV